MQSVSGTLAAAITARERQPVALVEVDWARDGFGGPGTIDDVTAWVSDLKVSRALTTDLPEQARSFKGITAASGTVEMAKDEGPNAGQHAAWYFSPYNTASPIFGFDRKGAPCRVSVGFRTSAGLEYMRQLTGRVRRIQPSSRNRMVTLELVDNREALAKQVTLPMIIADDGKLTSGASAPGLTGAFLADYVLRQCNFYASPPVRSSCKLSATMHGSGWPEVGTINEFHGANYSQLAFPPDAFTHPTPAAKWVAGVATDGTSSQILTYSLAGTVSPNTGGRLFVEGWFRFDDIGVGNHNALWMIFNSGASTPYVSAWIDGTNDRLQVDLHRGGADTSHATALAGPSGWANNTWYYIAVYVEFNSGNVNVWMRKDAGAWVGPVTVTTTASQAAAAMDSFYAAQGNAASFSRDYRSGWAEALQVTTENGAGTPPAANDGFTPTALVMAGRNSLIATPVMSEQAWSILQQLADAELGMAGTLEDGTPFFRDRTFFTTSPQTVSQRTLSATEAVIDLDADESVDSVRNHIVIKASPPQVQADKDVWSLNTVIAIPAGGSKTFWAQFTNPVGNLDTSVTYATGSGSGSRYHASNRRDGQGTARSNLTFAVTPFAQSAKIVVTNPNGDTAYLVGNTGVANVTAGAPSLILHGDLVLFDQSSDTSDLVTTGTPVNSHQRQEASDATSIAAFGEQIYEEGGNPFLQHLDSIGLKATDLLAMLKDGKPTLQGLAIVGDPRLQLGDRNTVVDAAGLVISADVHLAEINLSFTSGDDGKLTQTISTRAV